MYNQKKYEPHEPLIYINFVKFSIRIHTYKSIKHSPLFPHPISTVI